MELGKLLEIPYQLRKTASSLVKTRWESATYLIIGISLCAAWIIYSMPINKCKSSMLRAAMVLTSRAPGKAGDKKKDTVLILGPCNAGKTQLLYSLQQPTLFSGINTVTSLLPNIVWLGTGKVDRESPLSRIVPRNAKHRDIQIVDYPGHPRLRPELEKLLSRTLGIIYMIDATDKPSLKVSAETLYTLFLHSALTNELTPTPFLLAYNKVDLPAAKSKNTLQTDLLREIERLRVARTAAAEMVEDRGVQSCEAFLGVEGKIFDFEDAPVPVTSCSISATTGQISPVVEFLRDVILCTKEAAPRVA